MRSEKFEDYQWIGHLMCHFTKFHFVWPLRNKTAAEVVTGLQQRVLAVFGLPKILQCDNGTEFKNALMSELVDKWPGI